MYLSSGLRALPRATYYPIARGAINIPELAGFIISRGFKTTHRRARPRLHNTSEQAIARS